MVSADSGQARQTTSVSVTVTPASASVPVNTTKQFAATVQNSANQAVTWGVNGVSGGNSTVGMIDATGLYTAPSGVPSPAAVTVQATSQATPTAVGTAIVTVAPPPPPVSVTISPTSATVRVGRTVAFKAAVQNGSNTSVTWQVNGMTGGAASVGLISSLGTYKAPPSVPSPNTVKVTAVSVADPTKSASAMVTISKH
jgi:hypothetical protein